MCPHTPPCPPAYAPDHDAAYDEAYAVGTRFSLGDLVEYALDDLDDFHLD